MAASYAAALRRAFSSEVTLDANGRSGQFEVQVDGRPVVSRKGGLLAKLMGKGWPSDEEVVSAVRESVG